MKKIIYFASNTMNRIKNLFKKKKELSIFEKITEWLIRADIKIKEYHKNKKEDAKKYMEKFVLWYKRVRVETKEFVFLEIMDIVSSSFEMSDYKKSEVATDIRDLLDKYRLTEKPFSCTITPTIRKKLK